MPAKPRDWKRGVVIPALAGALAGLLISFLFPAKYTSRSLVSEVRPENLDAWGPVILEDYEERLATMQRQILASDRLLPMIERLSIVKPGQEERLVEGIRRNMRVEPALSGTSKSELTANNKHGVPQSEVLGFYVIYTDSSPRRAQQVCDGLISVLIEEIWKQRIKSNDDTQRFLESQIKYAHGDLQTMHAQLVRHGRNKRLANEYRRAQRSYTDLTNELEQEKAASVAESKLKSESDIASSPASLPESHVFRKRTLCAGAGLLGGLLVRIALFLM